MWSGLLPSSIGRKLRASYQYEGIFWAHSGLQASSAYSSEASGAEDSTQQTGAILLSKLTMVEAHNED